ncbi:MAG: (S)-ureidoglycine aminohydrolase [Tepidisphaeraceae bacterium]
MRTPEQLVHSRARVRPRYALMPLEGFPVSRLPGCPEADVRVLASPAIGARFVQMLIDLPGGRILPIAPQADVETFYFVLSGRGKSREGDSTHSLETGGFGLLPPGAAFQFTAGESLRLLTLQKRYEPARGIDVFKSIHGQESKIERKPWADNPHSLLQTLIPDEMKFDLAVNIFAFDPGFGLPIVETHVMEHGLLFLQGKGLYYLDDEWMEVEANDFIWMGPFCPQSFYATGPKASRYIYYKNVNREILV